MTKVLASKTPLSMHDLSDSLPPVIQEMIEQHVGEFPTKESIQAICEDPRSNFHMGLILGYFLMESPLDLLDLRPLVAGIGVKQAHQICQATASRRNHRELLDWKPRWGKVHPALVST